MLASLEAERPGFERTYSLVLTGLQSTITRAFAATGPTTVVSGFTETFTHITSNASPRGDWDLDYYRYSLSYEPTFLATSNDPTWASFVSYGRKPACTAAYLSYVAAHSLSTYTDIFAEASKTLPDGQTTYFGTTETTTITAHTSSMTNSLRGVCCDICEVDFGRVSIYYWPVPNANTSCLASGKAGPATDSKPRYLHHRSVRAPQNLTSGVYATASNGFVLLVLYFLILALEDD